LHLLGDEEDACLHLDRISRPQCRTAAFFLPSLFELQDRAPM
jgi:hypothetical protein